MHVSLEFNGTILVQAVSFLIFVFLMERLFFRPVMKAVENRREYVADCHLAAKNLSEENQRLQEERLARIQEATREAQMVISRAVSEAEGERREALALASAEAKELVNGARREIAEEKERAKAALSREVGALSDIIREQVLHS